MFRRLLILFLLPTMLLLAQPKKRVSITVQPVYGLQNKFGLNQISSINQQDSITFEMLRFYVSDFELLKNGKTIWKEKMSYHLIDASFPNSYLIASDIPINKEYDAIQFRFGIDSLTNVNGAMNGDLDPTKGMYWTWQSGYINFKMEGHSSRSPEKNKNVLLHLGGYASPFNSSQIIQLKAKEGNTLKIQFDIKQCMEKIDFQTHYQIMSPGTNAVELMKQFTPFFYLQ